MPHYSSFLSSWSTVSNTDLKVSVTNPNPNSTVLRVFTGPHLCPLRSRNVIICSFILIIIAQYFWFWYIVYTQSVFSFFFTKTIPFLGKKTFLGQNKSFWGPLELVEKLTPEAGEITASVKDLPGLK